MEPYIIIPFGRRSAGDVIEGAPFHTHRRLNWEVAVNVLSLAAGGSVTVTFESSPDAQNEDTWGVLHSFGALSTVAEVKAYSFIRGSSAADFAMAEKDIIIRGQVTASVGEYVIEMRATGRFVDITNVPTDEALLPSVLRDSKKTRTTIMDNAETDVVRWLMQGNDDRLGTLFLNSDDATVKERVRDAIIQQATMLQRSQSFKDSAKREDFKLGRKVSHSLDPRAEQLLLDISDRSQAVWLGR